MLVPDQDAARRTWVAYHLAAREMNAGLACAEIRRRLLDVGIDTDIVDRVVRRLARARAEVETGHGFPPVDEELEPGPPPRSDETEATHAPGTRDLAVGALLCAGGLATTWCTFRWAAGEIGAIYLVAWAAMVAGAALLVRGLAARLG